MLAKKIEALEPDIVFLQEVILAGDERHFRLRGYHQALVRNGPMIRGGLVMLCRYPIRNVRFFQFGRQGAWHNLQVSDRFLGKGWLEAEVPEWDVHILNTHLVSTYRERSFCEDGNQVAQLEQLLRRTGRLDRVLLGGDFNFMTGTSYHAKVERLLEDVSRGLNPDGISNCQPKIDHLFVGGLAWRESHARFVPPGFMPMGHQSIPLTDHAGIYARVDLDQEAEMTLKQMSSGHLALETGASR
jgi:endonuclease/exonuclease/phosphatase family metal-dependent hydrolase